MGSGGCAAQWGLTWRGELPLGLTWSQAGASLGLPGGIVRLMWETSPSATCTSTCMATIRHKLRALCTPLEFSFCSRKICDVSPSVARDRMLKEKKKEETVKNIYIFSSTWPVHNVPGDLGVKLLGFSWQSKERERAKDRPSGRGRGSLVYKIVSF